VRAESGCVSSNRQVLFDDIVNRDGRLDCDAARMVIGEWRLRVFSIASSANELAELRPYTSLS